MKIVYSFNKRGYEARFWESEISAASAAGVTFIPFNHGPFLDPNRYVRAQLLDNLYHAQDSRLMEMYRRVDIEIKRHSADALIVDNFHPYHPEFLRKLNIYKVLRTSDGPISAYDRDFAYLHAYDHVLYHSPAYSADLTMDQKLLYCGAKRLDWWPLGLFDSAFNSSVDETKLMARPRDIDVIFVGAMHVDKMSLLASMKRVLGRRFQMRGISSIKKNVFFNLRYGFPGWVRPVDFSEYVPLYQRSKIGINLHNRGKYTIGNYRLFELPANGVMQISDGGEYLDRYFNVGEEIIGYRSLDELVDRVRYYLDHDDERTAIATSGRRRVMRDYRFSKLMHEAASLIKRGLESSSGQAAS